MRSLQGQPIDIAKWTQYFAFDVIGELGFGDWFGNVDAATDQDQLGYWVFLTLTGHAVLGWTWLRALVARSGCALWLSTLIPFSGFLISRYTNTPKRRCRVTP